MIIHVFLRTLSTLATLITWERAALSPHAAVWGAGCPRKAPRSGRGLQGVPTISECTFDYLYIALIPSKESRGVVSLGVNTWNIPFDEGVRV